MRGIFGLAAVLVALGGLAVVLLQQLRGTSVKATQAAAIAASQPVGNVRETSQAVQRQVGQDVGAALQQGAGRAADETK